MGDPHKEFFHKVREAHPQEGRLGLGGPWLSVGLALNDPNHIFQSVALLSSQRIDAPLDLREATESLLHCSPQVPLVERAVLEVGAGQTGRDAPCQHTLGHEVKQVGVRPIHQVRVDDHRVLKMRQSIFLGFLLLLEGVLLIFAPVKIVLDRAHCYQLVHSMLLREPSSRLQEAVLVTSHRRVIMSKEQDFLSPLKSYVQGSCSLHLPLVQGGSIPQLILEAVDPFPVGSEV
mmetsp:Transcript_1005/g.1003  ORF Transcript_1005/g.1003 Transcript_1005/m.1003 type:complete len:232 (-) Transcript_1005:93-788(-)